MNPTSCHEIIEALAKAGTVEEIHALCCAICERHGFDHFIYGASLPTSFVTPHLCIISGYPKEWRDRYQELGYQGLDPTVRHCASHITPIAWDAIGPLEKADRVVTRLMGESREFGLKSGLSLPVHGAGGEFGMLSLAANADPEKMRQRIREILPEAHLLTAYLHEAVRRVVDVVEIVPAIPRISKRERECLAWSAEGKTSWEISQILGIAERTVIFHLQNVSDKLKVVNRQQAVARAVVLGLLTPQFA
jgi:LuxR family transcriptional activator of bioluminescence operon